VYDRAGGLGARTILAHAIHLSDAELARLVETDTRVAHCPASNLFLASGIMPLSRYREAGLASGSVRMSPAGRTRRSSR
jgi:guanine deaminase